MRDNQNNGKGSSAPAPKPAPVIDPKAFADVVAAEVKKSMSSVEAGIKTQIAEAIRPSKPAPSPVHQGFVDDPDNFVASLISVATEKAKNEIRTEDQIKSDIKTGVEKVLDEFPQLAALESSIVHEMKTNTDVNQPMSIRAETAAKNLASRMKLVPRSQDKNHAAAEAATMSPTGVSAPVTRDGKTIDPVADSKNFIAERRKLHAVLTSRGKPSA